MGAVSGPARRKEERKNLDLTLSLAQLPALSAVKMILMVFDYDVRVSFSPLLRGDHFRSMWRLCFHLATIHHLGHF